MLGSCALFLVSSSSILLEKPLYLYTGEPFCRVVTSFFVFGTEHWFPGGLGIALFRWLLIKYSTKLHIDKLTGVLISCTALAFSSIICYLSFNIPNANFNPTNICLDRSEDFRTTYYDYSTGLASWNDTPIFATVVWVDEAVHINHVLNLLFILTELVLYASICLHLRQQDKKIAHSLNEESIKRRQRRNINTLFASIVSFVFEIMWMVLLILLKVIEKSFESSVGQKGKYVFWIFRRLLLCLDGMLSIVQIATSSQLRNDCISLWRTMKDCADKIWCFLEGALRVIQLFVSPTRSRVSSEETVSQR